MEKEYWTLKDYQKLMSNLRADGDEYYKELIVTALEIVWHAKLRRYHLYALRWEDVDFDDDVICVRNSVSYRRGTNNYFLFENETSKKVKMDEKLTETLKKWKEMQSRYLLYDDGFVISFFGSPMRSKKMERYVRDQAKKLGLEPFSFDMLKRSSIIFECMYSGKGLVRTWLDSHHTFRMFANAVSPVFGREDLKKLMRNEYMTQNEIKRAVDDAKADKTTRIAKCPVRKECVSSPKHPMISSKDFYESDMNARKVKATIGVIKADMINEGYSSHGIAELKEFPADKLQKGTLLVFDTIESEEAK